jgi:quercetin 2,3-dioxygenase
MSVDPVVEVLPLGFPWPAADPFLFCVHHDDAYPPGNDAMGPQAPLSGRNLGMDFEIRDGWRMYHGRVVPGFPRHPHRGFETVTLARRGFIDHADSLGATARFGHGDVQWMTAGRGVEHAEMFPLVHRDGGNPTELFQIWLNLPRRSKLADPYFTMLWSHRVPKPKHTDAAGRSTEVTVVAGQLGQVRGDSPPPDSWAADPANEVAIWVLRMDAGATFELPAASAGVNRTLYLFSGDPVKIGDREVPNGVAARIRAEVPVTLTNGGAPAEILMLQGRPIGEPVVQHGPFVMNTRQEIVQAIDDYQRGTFGRWAWRDDAPVHARESRRFAIHADGRREDPS